MEADPNESPRHFYNFDEYFALEHVGDARYEYWDGDIVCMSGGTEAHGLIAGNIHYRIRQRIEGGPCVAFTADVAVRTPSVPPYRYPDVKVACGKVDFEDIRGVDALINPVLIVEVLSPATATRDRNEKFTAYKAIRTFKEYILVAQNTVRITHFVLGPDAEWTNDKIADMSASLTLACLDCVLPVREIYEGVRFKKP